MMSDALQPAALTGDLAVIGIAELLQMFALQQQTGMLDVDTGAGDDHVADTNTLQLSLYFIKGRIAFVHAERGEAALRLGRVLVAEGFVDRDELNLFIKYRRGDTLVGQELLALGYISASELRQAIERQSEELFYELLRQRRGRFAFFHQMGLPAHARELDLSLATDALLLEGYRRADELERIQTDLGSAETVLVTDSENLQRFGYGNLNVAEQDLLSLCNGRRTVDEILLVSRQGPFDTLKTLHNLRRSRLVDRSTSRSQASSRDTNGGANDKTASFRARHEKRLA